MIKRLTRHGNSLALVIDRAILELLKVDPDTPLELTTDGVHGFMIFGKPADAASTASLRVVKETEKSLLIQVYDPTTAAELTAKKAKTWVGQPHVEVWTAEETSPEDNDGENGVRLVFHQLAVGLDGQIYAGANPTDPMPKATRWTTKDEAGRDVTVVTYGACCEIALRAGALLQTAGIDIEVIDVQTLLPFDLQGVILESIRKTNRVLFLDEDCPGGATAYMMQEVLERQGGFQWLDAAPRTRSAKPHRPAYGSDGDYFSKPNREQILEMVYTMMREVDPRKFPPIV